MFTPCLHCAAGTRERSRTLFVRCSRRTGLQEYCPSTALLVSTRRSAQGVSETSARCL